MKTKHYIFAFLGIILNVVSCQVKPLGETALVSDELVTISASFAGSGSTKTFVYEDGTSVWWSAQDVINVFYGNEPSARFVSTNGSPSEYATFKGYLNTATASIESGQRQYIWGVYPYDKDNVCNGNSITLTVPAQQKGATGSFAPGMFPSIAKSEGYDLAFYHLCGGIVFSVSRDDIKSVTLKGNDDEPLAGKVRVAFNEDGLPIVQRVEMGDKSIILSAPNSGTFIPGELYYITILPGDLKKGYSLSFRTKTTEGVKTMPDSTRINRARFRSVRNADAEVDFSIAPTINEIIEFADPKVEEKLVAAFDKDGDGKLSYKEAASVTSLQGVFGTAKTYKSFEEFQYFTGVTNIPDKSFQNWVISAITLPESIRTIGAYAFDACINLESINIPGNVTKIGNNAFTGCTNVKTLSIPEGVYYMNYKGCSSLTSVSIPQTATSIVYNAFEDCSSLTNLVIPESVTSIGEAAFKGCKGLTTLEIPANVTSIGKSAFSGCSGLTEIFIPEAVTSIGSGAFGGCSKLTSIIIPDNADIECSNLFANCSSLVSVVIPDSVVEIGGGMFSNCTTLSSITIPEGVRRIGPSAFSGCTALSSIIIPEMVTSIGFRAFWGCTNLVTISIPKGVNSIASDVFRGCSNLTSIVLPEGITTIPASAFEGCSRLSTITIPQSVTLIGSSAFYNSGLTYVTIPDSVTSIEGWAFYGCNNLTGVTLLAKTPPSLGGGGFGYNFPIYVPKSSVEAYKAAEEWSGHASMIQAIPEP